MSRQSLNKQPLNTQPLNKQESDILYTLLLEPFVNQRLLSECSGHSLGVVNRSLKKLIQAGYLDEDIRPTVQASQEFRARSPRNAIILAAGVGMRMVPINTQTPKALMEVNGEPLIERIINQLHEVGIREIYVVAGFMKEALEYLMDEYQVELIVNEEYESRNNLHSLYLASGHLTNTYIIPCDIWCDRNPFHRHELYSWYMVSNLVDNDSNVRVNRKMELVTVAEMQGGNAMIGIAYLEGEQSCTVKNRLEEYDHDPGYRKAFWEETLYENDRMIVRARVVHAADVVEINTYEQLRELDDESSHLKSDVMEIIAQALEVAADCIVDITVLKKGMTNRSFIFTCKGKRYIMRIPGEGTGRLINRKNEAEVYRILAGTGICDNIAYLNPENGYKITEYFEGARVCNRESLEDTKGCMRKLREFHGLNLKTDHEFDLFGQIDFYEGLRGGPSIFRDYERTKEKVFSLKEYILTHVETKCLTHIDAVADNFLFTADGDIRLIDWEYAGMQDPHVDIAMFCIYSLYDREETDRLIDIYFEGRCPEETRIKIYCYMSVCGLLWSNWCEYKRSLGVEFGEYSLRQYRYAKDYYKIGKERMDE